MKNGEVLFPDDLDKRSFFSDINLQCKEYLTTHNNLMISKAYRTASDYAESTGHEYYGAYLFNALEGRINKIGEYELQEGPSKIRPIYQDEEPESSELYENLIWISGNVV